ncbi:DUF1697 domain-containing protein [Flagellimonas meridianipacifica]|uniref:Uncharacterized protein (DUF1697 family) n=1 Tax=Flagellimonas meridianipacifica TaxID=1080225 RepID=A0A2T0MFW1_9FLAO|nr:DUF1697 domain-containing protein [Allomuricauda pacifica]PRX56477.1 uncharacterized protein (DUF1697 family) [Allomuricauda pacifica]
MKKHIALLRGINVGGHKKIKMAELREVLSCNGFQEVQTYIQSGNIIFQTKSQTSLELAKKIKQLIEDKFGFQVPVLVITAGELRNLLDNNPFAEKPEKNLMFFTLLKTTPDSEKVSDFKKYQFENENFHFTENCVYLSFSDNYRNSKLNNNFIENKLGVEATTRNLKTMEKLQELLDS